MSLATELQPRLVTVDLQSGDLVSAAEQELSGHAGADPDKCFGYFPGFGYLGIYSDLPASQAFREAVPLLTIDGYELAFNFLRLSLAEQQADDSFHLDSDSATALTGDLATVQDRHVWRLLLNLSQDHIRRLAYINVEPSSLPIRRRGNYLYCPSSSIPANTIRTQPIPPRLKRLAQGVLFCSSQVLHTGQDDEHGHFVAAYGTDL